MGREGRLLERLGDERSASPKAPRESPHLLAESILRHLRKLLNTRPDQVLIQPDYGMPDLTELVQDQAAAVEEVQAAILRTITRFEPRLHDVSVTHVPSEPGQSILRFEIAGALISEREPHVEFRTEISPAGRVEIAE
ncbi:MAG: type VI secretion system baseplate subunit TssE [Nitrospira sp.]|uniref:GPW/gp25 family protein n=1 Tax=Nitrospira defluvii TaxID=330214 RepID=A0ABM8S0F5_9BACT|nr:type VI secretion system baseplate subunit TssE [Nitrospira defluvii]MCS6326515.1 type VI secretion system baseplate subunit TssE [Nitrospira sp.]CAE6781866.1 GPW/gp25 family protein [Nitrospira defluvii]